MISPIIKLLLLLAVPITLLVLFVVLTPRILGIDDLQGCDGPQQTVARCNAADAIVAISGGDTNARTLEATRLYKAGWAPKIIFSGAALDKQGASNAAAMRQQALDANVPSDDILIDEQSINTAGNAAQTRAIVEKQGIKRLILVTSPYHQRRASIEFGRKLGDIATIVNHPTSTDKYWSANTWWLTPWGAWLGFSELIKVLFVSISH